MANQSVSNERKKELEQMDPFQENLIKSMAYAKAHKKPILLAIAAVVIVVATFSGIMVSFERSENKASYLVAKAVDRYSKAEDPVKGYDAVKDDFQAVLSDYANTSSGKTALVKFAKICADAGEVDEAVQLYERALDAFDDRAGIQNFLLASLGHHYQQKNEPDKAKSYFIQIESGSSDLVKDEARFALAVDPTIDR